jgi:hypothetical protein
MGGSRWSDDLYRDRAAYRKAADVPTFAHDDNIRSGRTTAAAHDMLEPKGVEIREARDSDAHPNSVAIGVMFDVTGSMAGVPIVLQQKLTKLMGLLLEKEYCEDPQIMVGAVGDYNARDRVPLQIGQFESGIEIDEQLGHVYLERGGGGGYEESYQLALYFFARHTATDCWEKRGKKGFLFLIGDEKPYGACTPNEIEAVFGDTVEENVLTTDLIREVQERYHLFYVIPAGTNHYDDPELRDTWANLIGAENVLMLEDPDVVCETIGSTIGMFENALTLDRVEADLGGGKDAMVVTTALNALANSATLRAVADGGVPDGDKGKSTNVRL